MYVFVHRIPNFIRSPRELLSKSRREGFVGEKIMNRASTCEYKRLQAQSKCVPTSGFGSDEWVILRIRRVFVFSSGCGRKLELKVR